MRAKPVVGRWIAGAILGLAALVGAATGTLAQQAAVSITVKASIPTGRSAPANKQLAIHVKNLDGAAMEFESRSLRVEKVVAAASDGVVSVRPLAAGRYEFFDDFHQQTRGVLVVQ